MTMRREVSGAIPRVQHKRGTRLVKKKKLDVNKVYLYYVLAKKGLGPEYQICKHLIIT